MCTSLVYRDAAERSYVGRTLELAVNLPYQVAFFPAGQHLSSSVAGHPALNWTTSHSTIAITMPAKAHGGDEAAQASDLKIVEGLNDAGLAFSVQSYSQASGDQSAVEPGSVALSAADLGTFILGQFSTVDEVKAALEDLAVVLEPVPILGGLEMPFHYAVHDNTGASLVIEFHRGVRSIYDNPVGVMTNAPEFPWHLTNLNNYTQLDNVDHSRSAFMNYQAVQPGGGIAKTGLPASDTSVDRFIRAAFYAKFAEKQETPDKSIEMVAHIMNNFDRPRGITVDPPNMGSGHLSVQGQKMDEVPTEFTSWTSISDLNRRQFYVRDSAGMNYVRFDVSKIRTQNFRAVPMAEVMTHPEDRSASLA